MSIYSFHRIIIIKAYSHQGYPITYELSTESGGQSNDFAIDQNSGKIDLLRKLDYEKDPQQYHLRVMAIENGRPSRTSTVSVRIAVWQRHFVGDYRHNMIKLMTGKIVTFASLLLL